MTKFEKINVGDSAELTHTITQQDIEKFVDLTGDNNKLHVDPNFTGQTTFKKPVAHGMLGASFISTIIGTKLPGDGALWFSQNLEFLLPVRIGDEITIRAEVIKKNEASQSIELQTDIYNQHRQKVTQGLAKVKIIEQEVRRQVSATPLRKKVALVIGASGGIGQATARSLASDGYALALHYLNGESTVRRLKDEVVAQDAPAEIFKADITDEKQIKSLVELVIRKFDFIDLIVHCATVKVPAIKFSDLRWEDFQGHYDINIKAIFYLAKYVVPEMEKSGGGKIINVVSQYIEGTPPPQFLPYVTAKSALQGFSKALAAELAPKGIVVNLVSPGPTETELISDMPEKARLLLAAKTPLRRLAQPEDVAHAISFLASAKANYLAGETLRVNGGQVML